MSVQSEVQDFLVTLAEGTTGKAVTIDPGQIALQTGHSRDQVNKTLANLKQRKRIELLKGPNGRAIVGYKLLEPPADKRRRSNGHETNMDGVVANIKKQPVEEFDLKAKPLNMKVRRVFTPALDEYQKKKLTYEQMVEALGDSFEGSFKTDPMAEEALYLKERVEQLIGQVHDLTTRATEAERERDALRTRHIRAVEQKAVEAGATVVHSTD